MQEITERLRQLEAFRDTVHEAMYGDISSTAGNYALEPATLNKATEVVKRHVMIKRALRKLERTCKN